MSRPVYQLTEKDIKEANFRFLWVSIAAFNYSTQNGPGVAFGLAKALRKLRHPSRSKRLKDFLN